MTASTAQLSASDPITPIASVHTQAASDRKTFTATLLILIAGYLLLQNPYWVPAGDAEVYIATARNIALGRGYNYNGNPVGMFPPGWPILLAGVLKISPTFLFMKFVLMSGMIASLGMTYWICRRFASPRQSMLVVLLTAIITHVYQATFWMISESAFCVISSGAILLAFQLNERKPGAMWRGALLMFLCFAAVSVRWAGIFTWLIVAAALLHGERRPRLDDRWVRVVLSGVIAAGTFLTLRLFAQNPPRVEPIIRRTSSSERIQVDSGTDVSEAAADAMVATTYTFVNNLAGIGGYAGRVVEWGNWFSFLLWQPMRMSSTSGLLALISLFCGWCVLGTLLFQCIRSLRTKHWLWLALLGYTFILAMGWTHAQARYIMPIAPLIILAVIKGWENVRFSRLALGVFVGSIALCNGALFAADVWVARSEQFYARYEAGMNRDIIAAADWLRTQNTDNLEIGVCWYYNNLGRRRFTPTGSRFVSMLTDRVIAHVPDKYPVRGDPRNNRLMIDWARSLGIKYILYQPDVSPWRVYHFRMGWLQEYLTKRPVVDSGAGWRLYEVPAEGHIARRISLTPTNDGVTRVPGM